MGRDICNVGLFGWHANRKFENQRAGVATLVLTETVGHRAICQYIPLIDENSLIVAAIDAFGRVALRS